jgi:hypothetical protein
MRELEQVRDKYVIVTLSAVFDLWRLFFPDTVWLLIRNLSMFRSTMAHRSRL